MKRESTQSSLAAAKVPKKRVKKAKPVPVTERAVLTQPSSAPAHPCVIVSWNVDGLRAKGRLEGLVRIVAAHKPDVIVLQETKLQEKHHGEYAASIDTALNGEYDVWFASSGGTYGGNVTAKKGYAGVAALTRKQQVG